MSNKMKSFVMQGIVRVDPSRLTTHTFDFDQVDRAVQTMETKKDDIIKPLIRV